MNNEETYDIVIIGAGIVGCAIAEKCSQSNQKIAIIEDKAIGSGATAEGMGHIVVLDDQADLLELSKRSKELWIEAAPDLPNAAEFFQPGTLWIAETEEEAEGLADKQSKYSSYGIDSKILSQETLRELEPNLSHRLLGGLVVEDDAVLYPPVAAQHFLNHAIKRGAALIKAKAQSIEAGYVHLEDGRSIKCKTSINACGAMAHHLSPGIEVIPMKGHLMITDRYPGYIKHQLLTMGYQTSAANVESDSFAFNIQPRLTGQLLIGSTRQVGDLSRDIRPSVLGKLLNCIGDFLPQGEQLNIIRTWTGFRAGTADKLPLIGPHPSIEGHLIATGHGGLGITNAMGTAEIIADLIAGKESKVSIKPFLPSRFTEKQSNAS